MKIDPGVHRTPERPALGAWRVLHPERGVRPVRLRRQWHRLLLYAWPTGDGKLATRFSLRRHSAAVGRVLLVGPKYEVMASARTHTALWMDAGLEPGQQAVGIHPAGGVSLSLGALRYAYTAVRIVLLSTPRENVTWSEFCWISADALNSFCHDGEFLAFLFSLCFPGSCCMVAGRNCGAFCLTPGSNASCTNLTCHVYRSPLISSVVSDILT